MTHFESQWPSPCVELASNDNSQPQDEDIVYWKPVKRSSLRNNDQDMAVSLSNLESALELTIPNDVQSYFCQYFSHDISASAEQGPLTLIQAWNDNDFDRLQKNLIAHVLMKRRLKQADTLFFALTDEEDLLLSILLETGEVVLELVGKEPHEVVSKDLRTFISGLSPQPAFVSF